MALTTKVTNGIDIEEVCEVFFSSPTNRLVMAMLAVHDGDMTVKQAIEFSKQDWPTKFCSVCKCIMPFTDGKCDYCTRQTKGNKGNQT